MTGRLLLFIGVASVAFGLLDAGAASSTPLLPAKHPRPPAACVRALDEAELLFRDGQASFQTVTAWLAAVANSDTAGAASELQAYLDLTPKLVDERAAYDRYDSRCEGKNHKPPGSCLNALDQATIVGHDYAVGLRHVATLIEDLQNNNIGGAMTEQQALQDADGKIVGERPTYDGYAADCRAGR
jgi:hypothetical protein